MQKSLGTEMCISIRVITEDNCSKSDSKEEDTVKIEEVVWLFALSADETIRKAIDCRQGMTRRSKTHLRWFRNRCGMSIIIIILHLVLFGRVVVFVFVFQLRVTAFHVIIY